MGKNKGVARADAGTTKTPGARALERECFSQPPMLGAAIKASKRESARDGHALTNTEDDTDQQVRGVREKTVTITGAR